MRYTFVFLLLSLTLLLNACNKENVVSNSDLPENAWKFKHLYYPAVDIEKTTLVKQSGKKEYNVLLAETTLLKFSFEGNIQRIDSPNEIPSFFFNSAIIWYIETNYPDQHPIGWALEKGAQSVKLMNGTTLLFDRTGGFMKVL